MVNKIELVFSCFYLFVLTTFYGVFEARADIQKYFCSCFGSNENFKIRFRDLLTNSRQGKLCLDMFLRKKHGKWKK